MQLTTVPARAVTQTLESWRWVERLDRMEPVLASPFGAVFLQDETGYWWLDPISGAFEHVATETASRAAMLDTESAQDWLLLGGLAMEGERRGVHLGADEIQDLMPPRLWAVRSNQITSRSVTSL